MDALFQYGLQGVLAFGTVGAISLIIKKRFGKDLDGDIKLYLLVLLAFAFGFIPADFGNLVLEKLKVAVAIGVGVNALNTAFNKVGGK